MTPDTKAESECGATPENPVDDVRMSFGDHLEELRSCLIRALIGVALATAGALFFGKIILQVIFWPLFMVQQANGLPPRLQALGPTDAFSAYFKISLLAGLIVAMPWVLYQAWRFVAAGLYPREKQFTRQLTWASMILFVVGVLFLYFIALPLVLQFFILFNRSVASGMVPTSSFYRILLQPAETPAPSVEPGTELRIPVLPKDPPVEGPNLWFNSTTRRLTVRADDLVWSAPLEKGTTSPAVFSEFTIDAYLAFVLQLALAFGITFETPLIVCFLAWTNLVSTASMIAARRYIIFAIVVLAAVLTPPDVMSQMLLGIPMYLLFELGLRFAKAIDRARNRP